MRREDEFILACTSLDHSDTQRGRVRARITDALDWQYIFQASLRHAVIPILYTTLHSFCFDEIYSSILNKFQRHYLVNVGRNIHLTKQLLDIVYQLKNNGITSIPLKGPLLAEHVYGDYGLRVFDDLDILIWKHDALHTIQILTGMGYAPALKLSHSQIDRYMAFEDDLVFFNKKNGLAVEVHWEMSGRYLSRPLDMHFVHDGLRPFRLMNREIMHLSNEDLLLYLCVHGEKHMWARLEWIFSIAELIRVQQGIKWDLFLKKADELRCRRLVLHSIYLARDIFRFELPVNFLGLLSAEKNLPALAGKIKNLLFPLYHEAQAPRIGGRFNMFQIQLQDTMGDGFRYAIRELIEPKEADWHWLALPGYLSCLYVFLRPLRKSLEVGSNILKRMFGK